LLCAVSPIRFNVLTLQRFNGGEADCTLTPLLLDPFYGLQGKFLKIFRHHLRMDTKVEQAEEMIREVRAPEMFRILRVLTAGNRPIVASCNSC